MCKTIKQKVKFKASSRVIYELLADSKLHSSFSGKRAVISRKVGGAFSACSGYITGINVDLLPGKRIVQAWRAKDDLIPKIETDWRESYWNKMKSYLSRSS